MLGMLGMLRRAIRSRQGFEQLPSTSTSVENEPGVNDRSVCLIETSSLGWAKEPVHDHMGGKTETQGQTERPLCCQMVLGRGIVLQALS